MSTWAGTKLAAISRDDLELFVERIFNLVYVEVSDLDLGDGIVRDGVDYINPEKWLDSLGDTVDDLVSILDDVGLTPGGPMTIEGVCIPLEGNIEEARGA